MTIEHRQGVKCAEDGRPVYSGRLNPSGEIRHFHGSGRKGECYGNLTAGAAKPKPAAKPRKSSAPKGALEAQDRARAKFAATEPTA